ncbi:MAG: outer membrane beta-barrel protein [Cyclobacteriaceae bacterium]
MTRKVIYILLFFVSLHSSAQLEYLEGFIITNDKDTLRGQILNQTNIALAKSCQFKNEEGVKTYSPSEITEFGIVSTNRLFKSFEVTIDSLNQSVFLEYLVDGIADLFYMHYENKEYYYLLKSEQLMPLLNPQKEVQTNSSGSVKTHVFSKELYKGTLNYAFDNQVSSVEINSAKFNPKSLIKLTSMYHSAVCDWECTVFRKETKRPVSILPYVSIAPTKLHFASQQSGKAQELNINAGVLFKIGSYKSNFISLLSGLEYRSTDFKGNFTGKVRFSSSNTDSVTILQNIITIPVILRWEVLKNNRFQVYISPGLTNQFIINGTYAIYEEYYAPEYRNYRRFQLGVVLSAGVTYWLTNDWGITLNPYYEKTLIPMNFGSYFDRLRFTTVGIQAGLEIRLR